MSNKVICTCGHLDVNCGEIGILLQHNEDILVQWNNGIIENVQYDHIEFITNRNKRAYIVTFNMFEKLFLNKKEAEQFKKEKSFLGYKTVNLEIINL
jgi:hypothetical protein